MTEPPVDPRVPSHTQAVSPSAREQAIEELTKRFANDQLTMDEFERRAAAVYAASSPAALVALTADLQMPVPRAASDSRPMMHVGAVLGSVVRSGAISVPYRMEIRSILGNVELDLTSATFAPGVTEIELRAFMGNIEIRLPPHVGLEDHVSTVLGSFEYRRHPRAQSWAAASGISSVVRFTGKVVMSSVEVVVHAGGGSDSDDD